MTHSVGRHVTQPVELIDLFVTLADLAGAPMGTLPPELEGKTLSPLMAGAPGSGSAAAYTLYPRWREYDNHSHCERPYSEIAAIGLSVRTATFRTHSEQCRDLCHQRSRTQGDFDQWSQKQGGIDQWSQKQGEIAGFG